MFEVPAGAMQAVMKVPLTGAARGSKMPPLIELRVAKTCSPPLGVGRRGGSSHRGPRWNWWTT